MKHLIQKNTARWFRQILLAVVIGALSSVTSDAATKVEAWRFDSSASPANPEIVANASGSCLATVTPGAFASGWVTESPIFGSAIGVWDLGRSGTITCSGVTAFVGAAGQERVLTVKVTQFSDGAIYYAPTAVTVSGATAISSNVTFAASGGFGDWVTQETRWQLAANATVGAVQITSAYDGSLVDSVALETTLAALPPPQLTIQNVGDNKVQVSWPAGYSGMILESNGDASNGLSWSPVTAAVQTVGDSSSVTLDATNAAQFYRLKQP